MPQNKQIVETPPVPTVLRGCQVEAPVVGPDHSRVGRGRQHDRVDIGSSGFLSVRLQRDRRHEYEAHEAPALRRVTSASRPGPSP
jgi:hypothetical protein